MAVEEELGCKKPHFFRVLLPEFTEKMLLPRAFTQHIEPENRQKATILSPLGKFWHVDLKSDGRQLFFGDGWKEFARAHDFAVGFFLVFRYEGNLVFTIRVFDLSCCQKAYSKNNARRYSNQSAAMSASMSADETLDDDNVVEEEEKEEGEEEDIDDDDDDDEQEEGDDEDHDDDDYGIKFTEAGSSSKTTKEIQLAKIESTQLGSSRETKKQSTFTKRIILSNMKYNRLIMPTEICRLHGLESRCEIVLKDMKQRSWPVQFHPGMSTSSLRGGWREFCEENNVHIGDRCVFKLVSKRMMYVRIEKGKKF